jgi:SAM-dependent methyltransferase
MTKLTGSLELADNARAEMADLLDLQLSPLGLAAMDALAPASGETILDVGCGAGETLKQLAERVGATGHVIGVDIASRVLTAARSRTAHLPQVTLLLEDAAILDLRDESVDGVYSRFGVMAFGDPSGAFANLRRMIRRGGRIGFVCWRSLQENEIDFLPLQAAGLENAVDETPFSFERPDFVTNVLRSAGFGAVAIREFDAQVSSGDVDAMVKVLTNVGPLGKILRENPALLDVAEPRLRAALSARRKSAQVMLGAATWIVTAIAE